MDVKSRKKRVSKKLKSSWRKYVNIADVEEFLEDKRLEERLGPSLSTLPNDELFQIDSAQTTELLSTSERRKLKAAKPLKCFTALQPHSKVPDPIIKRNHVKTKEERKSSFIKLKELKNKEKNILKLKELLAQKDRELDDIKRKNLPKRGQFNKDIWNETEEVKETKHEEWLTDNTKKHNMRGIGKPVKQLLNTNKIKTSVLPAIEPPHPGMSYNPSFEDHQDLLRIIADHETKLIKQEKHLTRCTTGMFEKVTTDKRDNSWLVEMSEGLPSKGGTSIEDNECSDNDYKAVNPPAINKKKSRKQRRKQKEQLELLKVKRALKIEKKKVNDIHLLKHLNTQIEKMEKKQHTSKEIREKNKKLMKNKTKQLGSLKFEEPDMDFNMGKDISGNLKNMKMEGNLLLDRFKSMQKRNILAPTQRQVYKKPKVKRYIKPGHKDEDWKKTVAY